MSVFHFFSTFNDQVALFFSSSICLLSVPDIKQLLLNSVSRSVLINRAKLYIKYRYGSVFQCIQFELTTQATTVHFSTAERSKKQRQIAKASEKL